MTIAYYTLKKLGGSKYSSPKSALQKMAQVLKPKTEPGRFQFQILKQGKASVFHIETDGKKVTLHDKKTDNPTFEMIVSEETWLEMAGGKLAPMKAFLQDKMRVRGNIESGQRFLKQFSAR